MDYLTVNWSNSLAARFCLCLCAFGSEATEDRGKKEEEHLKKEKKQVMKMTEVYS